MTNPRPTADAAQPAAPHLPELDAEVIVVGGGAAGTTAALLLGRQQRLTIQIDSGDYRNAPSPAINMLVASHGISPAEFAARGRAAVGELDTVVRVRGHVTGAGVLRAVTPSGREVDAVEVRLSDGRVIRGQRLILGTGQHDHPNLLPGASELWGTGVLHCPYCHGYEAKDSGLAVVHLEQEQAPMAGLLAAYQALYLRQRFSESVSLVTEQLPPATHLQALEEMGVEVVHARALSIREDAQAGGALLRLERLDGDKDSGEAAAQMRVDHVFFHAPTSASLNLCEDLGLEMQGPSVVVDDQQRTSNPLVFAAGDGAVLRGLPRATTFVAQAQAQGQMAGLWADQDLFFAHPLTPPMPQSP